MSDTTCPTTIAACRSHAAECDRLIACCAPRCASGASGAAGDGTGIQARLQEARDAFAAGEYLRAVAAVKAAFDLAWAAWVGQATAPPVFSAGAEGAAAVGGPFLDILKQLAPFLLKLLIGL